MKEKSIKFFLYISNAITVQYFISYGRGERTDYLKLVLISIVFFLAGYIIRFLEKKISFNAVVFLLVAAGLSSIPALQNNWFTTYIIELIISLISFSCGFYITTQRPVKASILMVILALFVWIIAFYFNPKIVYNSYAKKHTRSESLGKPVLFNFVDKDKKVVSDKSLKGKVVLLDFWFIGCFPCDLKMKEFEKLAAYYKDNKDVAIITVNAGFKDSFESFSKKIMSFPSNMVHLYDSAAIIAKKLNLQGYPTEFLLDKNGIIRDEFAGYTKDIALVYFDKTKVKINALLNEN